MNNSVPLNNPYQSLWRRLDSLGNRASRDLVPKGEGHEQRHLRERDHLLARTLMNRSEWREAFQVLAQARVQFGGHIGQQADLVACLYQCGEIANWKHELEFLRKIYQEHATSLSVTSRNWTQLFLAKMAEEEGNSALALVEYEALKSRLEPGSNEYWNVLAQLLRVKSFFGVDKDLSRHYAELVTNEARWANHEMSIEVNHALMLAEISLVGLEHGKSRLKRLLDNEQLSATDARLVYFDFLEECLSRKAYELALAVFKEYFPRIRPELDFEKWLERIVSQNCNNLELQEVSDLSGRITPASFFRILQLLAIQYSGSVLGTELGRKLQILVAAQTNESENLWRRRLKVDKQSPAVLHVKRASGLVICNRTELSLAKKPISIQLLEECAKGSSLDLHDLVTRLWGGDFNSSYYDRVRMLVRRLNRSLAPLTGLSETIRFAGKAVEARVTIILDK